MHEQFDAVIIGAGPAGTSAAQTLAKKNWKVAIAEADGYGGTCPLRGCNPKKVMAAVTEMIAKNKQLNGNGLVTESHIDWAALQAFKRKFTEPVPAATEKALQEAGVTTFHGAATFVDEKTVRVGEHTLTSEKILIATGAKPTKLPIEGAEHIQYSEDFLDLEKLPKRIIFIGGGYISFEFAHIAARSGSEVHILQRGDQVLEGFDQELVDLLVKASADIGVQVHTNEAATKVVQSETGYQVVTDKHTWEADLIIAAAGRTPNIEGLALDHAGVKYGKGGISVNPFLQSTSNPNVYAAGDVADTAAPQLTPIAKLDAGAVVNNWLQGNEEKTDYTLVPSVVFTYPKLAEIGMPIETAKEKGFTVNELDMTQWFSYRIQNDQTAKAKIIVDTKTDIVLGAHIIGGEADQLINMLALCCQLKLKITDIQKVVYAFPTPGGDLPSLFPS